MSSSRRQSMPVVQSVKQAPNFKKYGFRLAKWGDSTFKVVRNLTHGNFLVATKPIKKTTVVLADKPMVVSPYSTKDGTPVCLSCHKITSGKCVSCQWPLCREEKCANDPSHLQAECIVFTQSDNPPQGLLRNEYYALEALRCLLLKKSTPWKWLRLMGCEAHVKSRKDIPEVVDQVEYAVDFVQNRCRLDKEGKRTIEYVMGVLAINTYAAFSELGRYSSILFEKWPLLSHDCEPNCARRLVLLDEADGGLGVEIEALKEMPEGEMYTIRYEDGRIDWTADAMDVDERRAKILRLFHFECGCQRCMDEMKQLAQQF